MFIIFLILILTALIIFYGNQSESSKWASFFIFCASMGALARTMVDSIIPSINEYHLANNFIAYLSFKIYLTMAFMANSCAPYGVFMFAITYSNIFNKKARDIIAYLSSIPIFVILFMGSFDINIIYTLIVFAAFYLITSCVILIYAWLKENNSIKKKDKFKLVIILVPTLISTLFFNYFARIMFPNYQLFRYVIVFIIISFILFIVYSFIGSVFGIKFRLERQVLDSTIKAMNSGTAIINHTIKNEIGKISLVYHNIKRSQTTIDKNLEENLEVLYRSKEHMIAMVDKIHNQVQEIKLEEASIRLSDIVEASLSSISFYFQDNFRRINIIRDYQCNPVVICDKVHLKEVIMNIIKNAVESIISEGILTVQIYKYRNNIMLSIKDNGIGISKENKANIFSPFFSTKIRNLNFGLGLSYCYNVLQKSGIRIEFESEESQGTTFFLIFSKQKIVEF